MNLPDVYRSNVLKRMVKVRFNKDYISFSFSSKRYFTGFVNINYDGVIRNTSLFIRQKHFIERWKEECLTLYEKYKNENVFEYKKLVDLRTFIEKNKPIIEKVHDAEVEYDRLLEKLGLHEV